MPAIASRIPSYRHHKPFGQAVVTIDAKDELVAVASNKMSSGRRRPCGRRRRPSDSWAGRGWSPSTIESLCQLTERLRFQLDQLLGQTPVNSRHSSPIMPIGQESRTSDFSIPDLMTMFDHPLPSEAKCLSRCARICSSERGEANTSEARFMRLDPAGWIGLENQSGFRDQPGDRGRLGSDQMTTGRLDEVSRGQRNSKLVAAIVQFYVHDNFIATFRQRERARELV